MVKRVFLTFLLLVLSSFVFSQNISKKYAEKLYYEKKFQESKEILDEVLSFLELGISGLSAYACHE